MNYITRIRSFEDTVYATFDFFKKNLDVPISDEQIYKELHNDRWNITEMWKIQRALNACLNLNIINYYAVSRSSTYITSQWFSKKVKLSEEKAKQHNIKLAEKLLKKRLKEL